MSKETKHLLKWQFEWAKRFFRTWFHILYRPAYKKWIEKPKLNSGYYEYMEETYKQEWI